MWRGVTFNKKIFKQTQISKQLQNQISKDDTTEMLFYIFYKHLFLIRFNLKAFLIATSFNIQKTGLEILRFLNKKAEGC